MSTGKPAPALPVFYMVGNSRIKPDFYNVYNAMRIAHGAERVRRIREVVGWTSLAQPPHYLRLSIDFELRRSMNRMLLLYMGEPSETWE
jgi:hypothetical protein